MRLFYIIVAVFGTALPLSQFIPWALEHGLDIQLFFKQLFANRISGFFGFDVIVSAVAAIGFIVVEGRRLNISKLWIPIAGLFSVGVSLGFPLFLAMRQHQIDKSKT